MSETHDFDAHDSQSPAERCCGDAAVYLLGLLDEPHSRAFLEHARSCALCSDDLAALAPAVDSLPATVPQVSAPAHAKRRVMAVVRSEAAQRAPRSSPRPGVARRGLVLRRPALALAGAGLLAAGVAIGGLATPFGGKSTPVGGPAARVQSAEVTLPGTSAALHQSAGHTWLTVSKMPEPSSGHVYEVWVKRPGHALPQPTNSLFAPTSSGAATVVVPDSGGADEVLVTQEPAGGTQVPTGPAVIVARLS
jgi:anti-sigma-K factor RskA